MNEGIALIINIVSIAFTMITSYICVAIYNLDTWHKRYLRNKIKFILSTVLTVIVTTFVSLCLSALVNFVFINIYKYYFNK